VLPTIHALTMDYVKVAITEFREETVELYGTADYVVDQGTYVMTYARPSVSERGNYDAGVDGASCAPTAHAEFACRARG
jgi:hypothetical protein